MQFDHIGTLPRAAWSVDSSARALDGHTVVAEPELDTPAVAFFAVDGASVDAVEAS